MVIASSISGLPIYAPSAAFAPTNYGDVSAIASAYQVVSATATQLYAGTAYVTSVNDAPLSAARAGNAANASLANSAYYDGTGRLISSLPDGAEVSAIASSYVESGVSSKQDTLSFAYNTADQISSINGSALGGMDEAAVSGIASAYAESAISSVSGNYYTTANESGYALSSDVSGTVDLVSTQSANWGGSALALSAGPGVKLEKVGNTLVVMADETLLWSGANTSAATLSEPYSNFERIDAVLGFPGQGKTHHVFEAASSTQLMYAFGQNNAYWCDIKCSITNGTAFTVSDAKYVTSPYGTSTQVSSDTVNVASAKNCLVKIYGINRTAEA